MNAQQLRVQPIRNPDTRRTEYQVLEGNTEVARSRFYEVAVEIAAELGRPPKPVAVHRRFET